MSTNVLRPYVPPAGGSPDRFTGFDEDLAHDRRILAEAAAKPGMAPLSEPLRMPMRFNEVFDTENATNRGHGNSATMHAETRQSLQDIYELWDANPPQMATIINFQPCTIKVNGGMYYQDAVPACPIDRCLLPPGQNHVSHVIDWDVIDMQPQQSGAYKALPIHTIAIAGNYMREGNVNPLLGPGCFIYDGDKSPEEMWAENPMIRTFEDSGAPKYTEHDQPIRRRGGTVMGKRKVPVTAPYREVYMSFLERRNAFYLKWIQERDTIWLESEGKDKKIAGVNNSLVRAQHEILLKIGLLDKPAAWYSQSSIVRNAPTDNCARCQKALPGGAIVCAADGCGWPVNPLEAYRAGHIPFFHETMDNLNEDELFEAMQIKTEREAKKKRVEDRMKAAAAQPAVEPQKPATAIGATPDGGNKGGEPIDFEAMTKLQLKQYAAEAYSLDLDLKMNKPDMIAAIEEKATAPGA